MHTLSRSAEARTGQQDTRKTTACRDQPTTCKDELSSPGTRPPTPPQPPPPPPSLFPPQVRATRSGRRSVISPASPHGRAGAGLSPAIRLDTFARFSCFPDLALHAPHSSASLSHGRDSGRPGLTPSRTRTSPAVRGAGRGQDHRLPVLAANSGPPRKSQRCAPKPIPRLASPPQLPRADGLPSEPSRSFLSLSIFLER